VFRRSGSHEDLRSEDLALALACARGDEEAWDRFLTLYREKLYSAALAIAKEESVARELADSLYADLFGTRTREDGSRISRLEYYQGRGSLEGWLKTVLAQQYIDRFRSRRKLVPFDDAIETDATVSSPALSGTENAKLIQATDAALSELAAEERFLLAAYYLDGRTLAAIGRMLNVHESTVQRRLEKTVTGLRKRVVALLRKQGLSKAVAEEMLELDIRELEIDIRSRLTQERQA